MSPSPNRAALAVDLGGKWQLYTNALPANARAIGVVSRGAESGALALLANGNYVQVNAGITRTLDQRKIAAAVAASRAGQHGGAGRGQGRRAEVSAGALQRKNVSLDAETVERLTEYGDGQLSLGIRKAAKLIG